MHDNFSQFLAWHKCSWNVVGLVSSSPFRKIICFNRFQSRALIKADMPQLLGSRMSVQGSQTMRGSGLGGPLTPESFSY